MTKPLATLARRQSLRIAIGAYLAFKDKRGAWGKRTVERNTQDLLEFAHTCGRPASKCGDCPHNATCGANRLAETVDLPFMLQYLERSAEKHTLYAQKTRWHTVAAFCRWCVRHSWMTVDAAALVDIDDKPWRGQRAKKEMNKGKPQLRNFMEVERYVAAAAKLPRPIDRLAALLPLLCQMRNGEVRHLHVGDVDWRLQRIWIRDESDDGEISEDWSVKSAAGRRTVRIPIEVLQDLQTVCAGQPETAYVLPSNRRTGLPIGDDFVARRVAAVCERACVRVVCPHGLRATGLTMRHAMDGLTPAELARLAGHADSGRTITGHYLGVAQNEEGLALPLSITKRPDVSGDLQPKRAETLKVWRSGRDLNPSEPAE